MIGTAWAGRGDHLYQQGRTRFHAAKRMENPDLRRRDFARAANDLRQYLDLFPASAHSTEARFNLGSLYEILAVTEKDRDAAARSLHFYRELIVKEPTSRLADDALVGIAEVCEQVFRDLDCRDDAYQRVHREYPSGDMAAKVPRGASRSRTTSAPSPTVGSARPNRGAPDPLPAAASSGDPALLSAVHPELTAGALQIRVSLSAPRAHVGKTLPSSKQLALPERYYIDIDNTRLAPKLKAELRFEAGAPVERIRFGQFDIAGFVETNCARIATRVPGDNPNAQLWLRCSDKIVFRLRG